MEDNTQKNIDRLVLSALVHILDEIDTTGLKLLPFLATACAENGMPIKNIMPFLDSFAKYMSEKLKSQEAQNKDARELQDLLVRSGFMTIGFSPDAEGGESTDGNGRDGA